MPRIRLSDQNMVGGPGNFAQAEAGAEVSAAREMRQIGRQLQDSGFDTMNRIQSAEDSQKASEVQSRSARDFSQWSQEDEMKNGIEGKSQRATDWWEKRRLEDEKSLGNLRATTMYRERVQGTVQKSLYDVEVSERTKRIEKLQEGLKTESDNYSKSLLMLPDPDQVFLNEQNYASRLDQAVNDGVVFKDDKDKLLKENSNKMTVSMFEGFLQKDERSVRAGAALLNGKSDQSKKFISDLTPDQLKNLNARFQSKIKETNQVNLAEQRRSLSDIVTELKMGGDVDVASGEKMMKYIQSNPESRKEETARMANEWRAAKVLNTYMKQAKMASPAELSAIQNKFASEVRGKDKTFGAADEVEMMRAFQSNLGRIQEMKEQDPLGYVFTNDSEMQSLAAVGTPDAQQLMLDRGIELQKKIGVPAAKQRVSSPNETEMFAQTITTLKDPAQMETVFTQMEQKYGKYSRKFFEEVASDKTGVGDLAVAGYVSDVTTRRTILGNMIRKDEIDEAFKINPSLAAQKDTIKKQVELVSQDMFDGFTKGNYSKGRLSGANGLKKAVEYEAKSMMATGRASDMDAKEVVKRAYQNIVEKNFEFENTGRSSFYIKRGPAAPRMKDVVGFVNTTSDASAFEALEPWADLKANMQVKGIDEKQAKAEIVEDLQRNHRWIVNNTDDGLMLVRDKDGQPKPVMTLKEETLPDGTKAKVRKPIEVPYSEINSMRRQVEKKTEASKQRTKLINMDRVVGRRGAFGSMITVRELVGMSDVEAESVGLLADKKKIEGAQ